jgi:hypothetical protein
MEKEEVTGYRSSCVTGEVGDGSAKTSGPQYSSTLANECARCSTKPVHAIASLVKGRGNQIVANGVGQTAVEGPQPNSSLPVEWRTRRRDVVTSRLLPGAVR